MTLPPPHSIFQSLTGLTPYGAPVTINFLIQKLKSKHLVCLSFCGERLNLRGLRGFILHKVRSIVPTGQQQLMQQQQGQVPRGGNGLQIPTSMEQMKGQATTLYAGMKEKMAPTPPPQPPSPAPQSSGLGLGGGDSHNTDHVIGGKIFEFQNPDCPDSEGFPSRTVDI